MLPELSFVIVIASEESLFCGEYYCIYSSLQEKKIIVIFEYNPSNTCFPFYDERKKELYILCQTFSFA